MVQTGVRAENVTSSAKCWASFGDQHCKVDYRGETAYIVRLGFAHVLVAFLFPQADVEGDKLVASIFQLLNSVWQGFVSGG